jgi:hypothetical protein
MTSTLSTKQLSKKVFYFYVYINTFVFINNELLVDEEIPGRALIDKKSGNLWVKHLHDK